MKAAARHFLFRHTDDSPKHLIGCAINSGSARVAELAGQTGFDIIWIDLEHSSVDVPQAEILALAAESAGAIPLFRIAGIRKDQVLPALDLGAKIIVAPMIQSGCEAGEFVRQCRSHPMGSRGYNTRCRSMRFGLDAADWAALSEKTCLLAQIESRESFNNLESILSTPGLDGILIGPGDLSVDMGVPGEVNHPDLIALAEDAIARAGKASRLAGIYAGEGRLLDAARTAGADLLIIGNDFKSLIDGWKPLMEKYRWRSAGAQSSAGHASK